MKEQPKKYARYFTKAQREACAQDPTGEVLRALGLLVNLRFREPEYAAQLSPEAEAREVEWLTFIAKLTALHKEKLRARPSPKKRATPS